jgi:hypothetical protein
MRITVGIQLILLFLAGFFFQGCWVADALFLPETEKEQLPLQDRCEEAVAGYINANKGDDLYKPYGFSRVIIHKPIEILELEELEKERKHGTRTGPEIDSLIIKKQNYIHAHNIERTAEISHYFLLWPAGKQTQTLLEVNYRLNDTLAIIDATPEIMLELEPAYQEVFDYYFHEYTIFVSSVYPEGRQLSNEFYTFFKAHQETLNGVTAKSAFLMHSLKVTKYIKEAGAFNPGAVTSDFVTERLQSGPDAVPGYESLQFTPLYEKRTADQVTGYYIFHKFIGRLNEVTDHYVIRADFTPYYELESISYMSEPFESFLNN